MADTKKYSGYGTEGSEGLSDRRDRDLKYKKHREGLARGIINTQHIFLIVLWYFITVIYFGIFTYDYFFGKPVDSELTKVVLTLINSVSFALFTVVFIWVMRIMKTRPWLGDLKYSYNKMTKEEKEETQRPKMIFEGKKSERG